MSSRSEDSPLTAAQSRELERRVRDAEDRTRYLLVSVLGRKFALYYNVTDDTFIWKDPRSATLFKRRAAAAAVKKLLSDRVEVVACRVDSRGRLVLRSVPPPRDRSPRPKARLSRSS